MIRRISMAVFALMIAAPLAAQAPAGWQMRLDESTSAADPDDVPDVTVTAASNGFQVGTGPAVVMWNPTNTTTGAYTLKGTFRMLEPSGHNNYYGLMYGGADLSASSQNYQYFLIGQNGSYIIKHRANSETVHDIMGRTPSDAVNQPGGNGTSSNELQVRVGTSEIEFVINGTVVHTAANSGMAGRTDGIWGVRINHVLPAIVVEGLEVVN